MFGLLLLALLPVVLCDTVTTLSGYKTKLASTSVPSVTTSNLPIQTSTYPVKRTVKTYSTVTVTPSVTRTFKQKTTVFQATSTKTVTRPAVTPTATEITTEYQTYVVDGEPTYTVTETVYVPSTSTVSPRDGFTAINDPGGMIVASPPPRFERDQAKTLYAPRRHFEAREPEPAPQAGNRTPTGSPSPVGYPSAVTCSTTVRSIITSSITVAGSPARTSKLATPSTTVTSTVTSKTVATVTGTNIVSTITVTSTFSTYNIITQDATYPATVQNTLTDTALPLETEYAECQQNNVRLNGLQGPVAGVAFEHHHELELNYYGYATKIECCIECAKNPRCGEWFATQGGCLAPFGRSQNFKAYFFDQNSTNSEGYGWVGNGLNKWIYEGDISVYNNNLQPVPDPPYDHDFIPPY